MNKFFSKKLSTIKESYPQNKKVAITIKNPLHVGRKHIWKIKVLGFLIVLGALCYLVYIAFFNIYGWVKTHEVIKQNPVIVRSPLIIRDVKATSFVSPVVTKEQREQIEKVLADDIRNATIERVYQYTRFLESRLGFDNTFEATHVYCQSINKVNEIGFLLDGNKKFCFNNEAEQKATFIKWLNKHLDGGEFTLNEALCLYVTGVRQPTCKRVMDIGL